ncbi:hypothetical protein PsYK624_096430 [Phanerochaete sordida]|uniref:Uncharacterized protein n=1 Tax=Phanerochaete sordida TaxID=48140 RepID=A0A9P3GH11_9APHY|nr:hypothetical protein PsYK624_096430 [Phanerochaete sordida]
MAYPAHSTRKSSNLENLGLGTKAMSQKVSRAVSQTVFRDASIRRRNRVLSGIKAPKPDDAIKRQKLAQPVIRVSLPTPPASPCTPAQHVYPEQPQDSKAGAIPRVLARPPPQLIRQENVAVVDPELAKVPVQYVRDGLRLLGPQMWNVAQSVQVPPFDVAQTHTTVKVADTSAQMPTHLLAVYKRPAHGKASTRGVQLHATHNLVLAAHCAAIPVLPCDQTPQLSQAGDSTALPVLAMALPHPESFAAVHEYLYTHDRAVFAARIVPYPSARVAAPDAAHTHAAWADRLAATYSQQVLLAHLAFAAGAYANMCALGIQDDGMWHALQASWTVLRGALQAQQQAHARA